MHRLRFESFGVIGEVQSDDRELFEAVPEVLPPGWRRSVAEPTIRFGLMRNHVITLDGAKVHEVDGARALVLRLGSEIRHRLAERAPAHVFIHAGVVQVAGCGVVVPGATHSGKTTLVAELVRAGATYYSDEYAVVDVDGMIRPFAKPLSIRPLTGDGLGELAEVDAAQVGNEPLEARLIVFTSYRRGARWRPTVCGSGEGAFELLKHTVNALGRPSAALTAAGRVCRNARILSGPRGEARETALALIEFVDTEARVG